MEVRLGPSIAVMVLSRAVKGTKLKTEAMDLLGLHPPSSRVQIGDTPKTSDRRFFGISSYGMGCKVVNLPHILGKSTVDCLRKSWEHYHERQETQTTWQRDGRICFRYKGSFTSPNTTICCIASTNTHSITNNVNTTNTVRFIANGNTTSARSLCTTLRTHSIKRA